MHRALRFKTHYQNPSVKRLAVHLKDEHFVMFHGGTDPSMVPNKETTLTAWFNLNDAEERGGGPEVARSVLYTDIVEKYRYHKGVWKPYERLPTRVGK